MPNYTYSDVDKSLSIDNKGNVRILYDVDVIIQSLKMIMGSLVGENPRSLIGSTLLKYLGRTIDEDTAEDIEDEVIKAIVNYEPRLQITDVIATPKPDENSYSLTIRGYVRELSEQLNFNTAISTFQG
jgi:phage baseplate assembly protein W